MQSAAATSFGAFLRANERELICQKHQEGHPSGPGGGKQTLAGAQEEVRGEGRIYRQQQFRSMSRSSPKNKHAKFREREFAKITPLLTPPPRHLGENHCLCQGGEGVLLHFQGDKADVTHLSGLDRLGQGEI